MSDIYRKYGLTPPGLDDTTGLDVYERYGLTPPGQVRQEPTFLQQTGGVLAGAARGLASALEPLQMPKDVFDALLAGTLDESTTIADRFSRLRFATYAPFGAAPTRATTGSEIVGLMGIENEFAQRWGGLAFDLVADPLIVGGAVSGVGRVARLAGAVDAGNDLIRMGRSIDTALSPVGLSKLMPDPVRNGISKSAEDVGAWLFNLKTPAKVDGETLTLGDLVAPRSRALSFRLGEGGRLGGAAQAIVRAEGLARQQGQNVQETVLENLQALEKLFGPDRRNQIMQGVFNAIGRQREAATITKGVPEIVRSRILSTAYDQVQKRGAALVEGLEQGAETANPVLRNLRSEVPTFAQRFGPEIKDVAKSRFEATVADIGEFAKKHGFSSQRAQDIYREATRIITESDALLGFELSLYRPIKELFFKAVAPTVGTDAVQLWDEVLQRGMNGENVSEITEFVLSGTKTKVSQLFGKSIKNLGQVLRNERAFEVLDFNAFLRALPNGHLRRTFGVYQDADTFDRYAKSLIDGVIIPSNVIDEVRLPNVLGDSRAGTLAREYIESIANPTGTTKRGFVIHREGLIRHLRENGISAAEANRVMVDLGSAINSDKRAAIIQKLYSISEDYQQQLRTGRAGTGSTMFRAQRNVELERDALELLGEIGNPILSLFEQAEGARRTLPIKLFLSDTFKIAQEHNLVSKVRTTKNSRGIPKTATAEFGAFAGKFVHPELYKQLVMAMARPNRRSGIYQNLRSLITGGYLASPNVVAANIAGGIFTTAGLGISPLDMVRSMATTALDFFKAKNDPTYHFEDYLQLRQRVPLNGITLVDTELAQRTAHGISREAAGMTRQTFGDSVNGLIEIARTVVGKMGLDAFSWAEVWMKTSAFRAAKQMGMSIDEAAEVGRLSTFDYSELPEMLRYFRDTGFLMFPGFPYFMTGRAVGMALNNPKVLAVADRVDEALGNAIIGDEERVRLYASMPEWLRDAHGLSVRVRTGPQGEKIHSVLPLNELFPVDVFYANPLQAGLPFAESVATGGIFRPLAEVVLATMNQGEAVLSKRFGAQVFQPGLPVTEQLAQTAGFLFNSFSPGAVRKVAGYHPEQGVTGIARAIHDSFVPLPDSLAQAGYTYSEVRRNRPDRDLVDSILGATVRSVQPIATSGPMMNAQRNFEAAQRRHNREMSVLKERARKARAYGNLDAFTEAQEQMREREARFQATWRPIFQTLRESQE